MRQPLHHGFRAPIRRAIEGGTHTCYIMYLRMYLVRKGRNMKNAKIAMFLVIACTLFLLAGQSAFGAIKIVKFNVPSCE